jgi:hypothetical protein
VLTVSLAAGACSTGEELVTIPGQAHAGGRVYIDVDGNREPGGPDRALPGVRVLLLIAGSIDTLGNVTSDGNGDFAFGAVPVGRYTVVVPDAAVFGDSLTVVRIDTAALSLGVDDTSQVNVAVSFPAYTALGARSLPLGEKIFIEGLALNASPSFGDSTVHLRDTTGAILITGARGPAVATGDSVRFLGRVGGVNGQSAIIDGQAIILQIGSFPTPVVVTTATAAVADAGRLDADLVRIVDGMIGTDTATIGGDYQFSVDDGSGPLRVVMDFDVGLTRTPYVPGVVIDATGVLRADGGGAWRLKPRINSDLVVK